MPSTLQLAQSSALPQRGGSVVSTANAAPAEIGARAMAVAGVVVGPAAMAAPVSNHNRVVGALVVGSASAAFAYTEAQQATLVAFAEHVSLALSDASTLADMREANHDALTGLASRRLFMERLQQSVAHAAHNDETVAILFLDLDRFKMVNDVLGHAAGDLLLIEVARRLRVCLRGRDSAARLGGDEFAVLLPAITDPHLALAVAERILTALRAPVIIDGRELFIEASIGVASGVCADDDDGETILRDADVAMYEAKRSGADRAVVFQSRMRGQFQARVQAQAHAGLGRRPGSTAFLA